MTEKKFSPVILHQCQKKCCTKLVEDNFLDDDGRIVVDRKTHE